MPLSLARWLFAVIAVFAAAVLVACGSDDGNGGGSNGGGEAVALEECDSPPSEITVGATLPMSGSGAPYGAVFSESMQIAVDEINEAGGVAGETQINLKVLDDEALAGPAVQNMRQLVQGDDAVAVVSAYNDPPLALATVGQQEKVPVFNGGGNGTELAGNEYLWNNVAAIDQEAQRVYEYVANNEGFEKIAVLAATNYTAEDIGAVEETAQEVFGEDNVMVVTYDAENPDVKSQLQQIQDFGPDGIHFLNSGTLTQTAAKNMSELNVGIPIVGTSGTFFEPGILEEPSMEGAYASAMEFEPSQDFARKAQQATGVEVNAFHGNSASIISVIAGAVEQLIEQGYCVTGEGINQMVLENAESGEGFEGYGGIVKYAPDGGSARELAILSVQNGQIETVEAGAASGSDEGTGSGESGDAEGAGSSS